MSDDYDYEEDLEDEDEDEEDLEEEEEEEEEVCFESDEEDEEEEYEEEEEEEEEEYEEDEEDFDKETITSLAIKILKALKEDPSEITDIIRSAKILSNEDINKILCKNEEEDSWFAKEMKKLSGE